MFIKVQNNINIYTLLPIFTGFTKLECPSNFIISYKVYLQVIRTFNKVFTLLPYFGGSTYKDQLVEDVPIRIYTPKNPKSDAVVVYLHGGEGNKYT